MYPQKLETTNDKRGRRQNSVAQPKNKILINFKWQKSQKKINVENLRANVLKGVET